MCVGAEWHRFPSSFLLPGERYRLQFIRSGFTGLLPRPFNASEVGLGGRCCCCGCCCGAPRSLLLAALSAASRLPLHHRQQLALPFPPNQLHAQGGTRGAAPSFNDRNTEQPEHYWTSTAGCAYLVTLRDPDSGALLDPPTSGGSGGAEGSGDSGGGEKKAKGWGWKREASAAKEAEEGPDAWEELAALPFVDNALSPPLFRAFYVPRLSPARNRQYTYLLLRRRGQQPA